MVTPHISVIMPAYNVAPWIGQAVESLYLQEDIRWELIIVDDGSQDGTRAIAARYAELDERISVLKNDGQKGAGGCRNTGMRAAQGRTLFFLDSDDALFPSALSNLFPLLGSGSFPVVKGQNTLFCHQRWLSSRTNFDKEERRMTIMEASACPVHSFWLHLYDAAFLAENSIRFPEDLIIGQDTAFLCHVYSLLDQVPVSSAPVYLYRINHKPFRPTAAKSLAFVRKSLMGRRFFEQQGKNDAATAHIVDNFLPAFLPCLHTAATEGREEALQYLAATVELFMGQEDRLHPHLRFLLGDAVVPFLEQCGQKDLERMLQTLEEVGLTPQSFFVGIERPVSGPGWQVYRLLRRGANLVRSPHSLRILRYFHSLQRQSRQRIGDPASFKRQNLGA